METLLGPALVVGACCGLPLAVGGTLYLLGKGKRRETVDLRGHESHSAVGACCQPFVSTANWAFRRFGGKKKVGP